MTTWTAGTSVGRTRKIRITPFRNRNEVADPVTNHHATWGYYVSETTVNTQTRFILDPIPVDKT